MAVEFGPKDRYRTYGVPSLDLPFADRKSLVDRISGNNLVTFTRSTTATYVGSDGLIKTAAINEPRFDHNPLTRESLGLLVEEARTNFFKNSSNLGASLTDGTCVLTGNQLISPDGTLTATKIAESLNNESQGKTLNFGEWATPNGATGTANVALSLTGFVKAGTLSRCAIAMGGGGAIISVNIDLTNGSYTQYKYFTVTGDFIQVVPFPNGWYQIKISARNDYQYNLIRIFPRTNNTAPTNTNAPAYQGTGAYFYAWGFQWELSSFPTSYIPTTGSTVTRAADVATVSNTNSSIYPTSNFTIINQPYGTSGGSTTLKLMGPTIKRTSVYSSDLSQTTINSIVNKTDEFWQWRVLGSSFALPNFTTNGSVTVDWGDGVVETLTTAVHTFTNGGGYHDIGFRLNSGTYFKPSNTNGNSTYGPRIIAIGPAPASMTVEGDIGFSGCSNLQGFDSTVKFLSGSILRSSWSDCSKLASFPLINTTGVTNFSAAWNNCTSLTSFPLINTASGTTFDSSWYNCASLTSFPEINTSSLGSFRNSWGNCTSLTSFPLINTSNGTDFTNTWVNCNKLVSFPALNLGNGTSFYATWRYCSSLTSFAPTNLGKGTDFSATWQGCSSLTSFPAIDASAGTIFPGTWQNCTSLTSFPDINMGAGTNFVYTWASCSSLTSFLSTRMGKGTSFLGAWVGCSSLTSFPANAFNTTGILSPDAFNSAFSACALTAQSIENILVSLNTNGQSGITLTLSGGTNANTSTWSATAKSAYISLIAKGWTITQNGTAPT